MKRFLILFLSFIVLLSTSVTAYPTLYSIGGIEGIEQSKPNDCEKQYNVSYYRGGGDYKKPPPPRKIRSIAELAERFPDWQENIFKGKYDDSFFADKFLLFITVIQGDGGLSLRATSVLYEDDLIDVEITDTPVSGGADDMVYSWIIVLEMPNEVADKDVSATVVVGDFTIFEPDTVWHGEYNAYESEYRIRYYQNLTGVEKVPHPLKFHNFIDLYEYFPFWFDEIDMRLNDFFDDNFLVYISDSHRTDDPCFRVTSVTITDDVIDITLDKTPTGNYNEETETEWIIVLEIPKEFADRDILVTKTGFGDVPPTGLSDVNGYAFMLFAVTVMTMGLWGYLLFKKKIAKGEAKT
ncbi:MAG: hypothetical protein FWG87_08880 [Defluviitaleaceae bacterium]|nr:hypothetical protein [Defluviitaleaceae bacterium]